MAFIGPVGLMVLTGPEKGRGFVLDVGTTVVGRPVRTLKSSCQAEGSAVHTCF